MKKICLLACLLGLSTFSIAQTGGLVAHWDMNGNADDTSGGGHNGTMYNVTPAVGMDGVMGHGLYFNGTNSLITVPYSPAFNVSALSICAVVYPQGFYTGTCQSNTILERGSTGPGTGNFYFYYGDKPGDNYDCYSVDTTVEVFKMDANGFPFASITEFNYTPHVQENTWYTVVVTFNDTTFKTYINGVLKSSVDMLSPGTPMGTNTDGINIGFDAFDSAAGYPYPFKGIIDDIKLFSKALTQTEVDSYSVSTTLAVKNAYQPQIGVQLFPNPAQDLLTIASTGAMQYEMDITVTDLLGRELIRAKSVNALAKINTSELAPGIYFANIYIGGQLISKKFLKE